MPLFVFSWSWLDLASKTPNCRALQQAEHRAYNTIHGQNVLCWIIPGTQNAAFFPPTEHVSTESASSSVQTQHDKNQGGELTSPAEVERHAYGSHTV